MFDRGCHLAYNGLIRKRFRHTKECVLASTIRDVARLAGVGVGTVSSVLNNSRPVNEATRRKVLAAVAELDFVPNPSGRRLSMGKTHTIGVLIPYFTSPAQILRLRGVMSVISASDYDINLFAIENAKQQRNILQTVPRQGRIDGLLIFSLDLLDEDVARITRQQVPTVLVEGYHPNLHSIFLDDTSAAQNAVEYLLELGHRNIAYVGEYRENWNSHFSQNRYQGYSQALQAAGVPIDPQNYYRSASTRAASRDIGLEILRDPDRPSAVFTYSDVHALGIMEAARDLNLDVPADLSIIGYDDIDTAHFAQLSTVRQYLYESGYQGINLLFDLINEPALQPVKIRLPTELIIRRTTAPPGPGNA